MADGRQERSTGAMANGQEGNLVIERDKTFHDDLTASGAPARLGNFPSLLHLGSIAHRTLAMTGRAHDRLYHTRNADFLHRGQEFFLRFRKCIRRSRQAQFFGRQPADAFAVHRQARGLGGRNDMKAFGFQLHQAIRGDGFHFRNDQIRFFFADNLFQCIPVQHGQDMGRLGDMHGRSAGIPVNGNDMNAIPL